MSLLSHLPGRPTAIAAILAAGVLGMTACSSSGDSESPSVTVTATATETVAETPATTTAPSATASAPAAVESATAGAVTDPSSIREFAACDESQKDVSINGYRDAPLKCDGTQWVPQY